MTDNTIKSILVTIGVSLIGAGLCIIYFIVTELFNVYSNIESSKFILQVTQYLTEKQLLLVSDNSSILLGDGIAAICAIIFLFLLAWSATSISFSLIKSGSHLLSPNIKNDIDHIKQSLKKLLEKDSNS